MVPSKTMPTRPMSPARAELLDRLCDAHRVVDAGFEYIVEMARELEVDGWAEHRKHCVRH